MRSTATGGLGRRELLPAQQRARSSGEYRRWLPINVITLILLLVSRRRCTLRALFKSSSRVAPARLQGVPIGLLVHIRRTGYSQRTLTER